MSTPIPRLETAERLAFRTDDGTEIFYRHAPAAEVASDKAIILLHRGHEHSGRWTSTAERLGLTDHHLFAWDARGHGRSGGPRGSAESFGTYVRDLETFYRHLIATHGLKPGNISVVAQSVGAAVAATWANDYAPPLRALVLANPAFSIRLYAPFAETGLRALRVVRPNTRIRSYVSGSMLTTDREQAASYETDPLVDRGIALNILLDLFEAGRRAPVDAATMRRPTLLLLSETDFVVHRAPQEAYFRHLGAPVKERRLYAKLRHALFNEADPQPALDAADFIRRCEAAPADESVLRRGLVDRGENTAEYEALRRPAPVLKRLGYAALRAGMTTVGRLSDGVSLGLRAGFDSGATLDYVYENTARGVTPLGRCIDRNYLDSAGWRGIRTRGDHMTRALRECFAKVAADGRPVRLLDIAAGRGRYAFAALRADEGRVASALLRDFDAGNVAAMNAAAQADASLAARVQTERGDAFDGLAPGKPGEFTVSTVSGLYELFPDNAAVLKSLRAVAAATAKGGFLVYTNQPRHPQLELIARTLNSHRGGAAWVMRRRSQAEMDALVAEAGFRKLDQRADPDGIFTVSVAVRE